MYLAENLKFLREQNGKTQGELAVLFGIEQKTISSWECGSRKPPIGTIVSLAKLYRVSLDDLVLTDMRPPIPVYALNLAYLRRKGFLCWSNSIWHGAIVNGNPWVCRSWNGIYGN